jgi:hypothetical protein
VAPTAARRISCTSAPTMPAQTSTSVTHTF